jgi:hypothetical protein
LCEPGRYSLLSAVDACTGCAAGKYTVTKGSDTPASCIRCSAGSKTNTGPRAGARACTLCEAGAYSVESSVDRCTDCNAGRYGSG